MGRRFTGVDALLYVMLRWARMVGVAYPPRPKPFIERVEQRETVRYVLLAEGLKPIDTVA